MKQKFRTFVAVDVDASVRGVAADLIGKLSSVGADVKWVEPENLHLTLKFLGDVDAREIHQVCLAVGLAAAEVGAFDFNVRGAGAFPSVKRPRTIWLGAGRGEETMSKLAHRIESALETIGYRREARRFTPHLTIGRVRRGGPAVAELGTRLGEYAEFEVGRTAIDEEVVYSSELTSSGPRYEVLGRAPLAPDR
jgi:2'-5' RNA ligase